ncbi:hypothetical protein CAPTEDRAFT_215809 [Capitella teleta]|uniref:EF-hand domain-containing protein n=1 Tax=Capitella teleta TaxID=283909 RepID=R7UL63_CAPTE|nr:hypothetical protein CAPTEDRAFT_215809 [Capitella teleta]|eukprot:ELU06848.1 hypothetical protein CAPTEDRAFT_215809 [Capitella teleta]
MTQTRKETSLGETSFPMFYIFTSANRDALFRILVTTLNAPMNPSQFKRLTERIGLAERQIINHIDFFSAFRSKSASEYPRWMDPIQRQSLDRSAMNATQVHAQLLDKARQKVKDIADLIPQSNPDGTGHILKPEFRNVLNKMGYCMEDDEFDKLWCK